MLRSMGLQNFRSYQEVGINDMGSLTVLIGHNNAGKSNILRAAALPSNHGAAHGFVGNDTIREGASSGIVHLEYTAEGSDLKRRWKLQPNTRSGPADTSNGPEAEALRLASERTVVLAAHRNPGGSGPWNDMPSNVGTRGEHTITALAALRMEHSTGADRRMNEIQTWAKALDIQVERVSTPPSSKNTSRLVVESFGRGTNLEFVGSGVASALPILVQGSLLERHDIMLIEEPEAHLHPKAMAGLLRYFNHLSERGVQVICTTHSLDFLVAMHRLQQGDEPKLPADSKIFHVQRDAEAASIEPVSAPGFGPIVSAIDRALDEDLQDTPVGSWAPGRQYAGWGTEMDA